jgi:hypothetical protein
MTMFRSIFTPLAVAIVAASPLSAAEPMAHKAMAGDAMPMKPMSATDKRMLAKCKTMPAAKSAKNAKCAKLMMKAGDHPMDKPMDHAM